MKVLIDIFHPAEFHLFKNVIKELKNKKHEVIVTLREKDNTEFLLKKHKIDYIKINEKNYGSIFSMIIEYITRLLKLFKIIHREKPSIMIAQTALTIAPLGLLFNIPVLYFCNNDIQYYDFLLNFPFVTALVTPESFNLKGPLFKNKHITFPGYNELAYMHKNRFFPDPDIKNKLNIDPNKKTVLCRFPFFGAIHEIFVKGITHKDKQKLISSLSNIANIFISSEYKSPSKYEKYSLPVEPDKFLDLLSICDLYIGTSPTVASEACMLGIPAIYISDSPRGFTTDLEKRYGICKNFKSNQVLDALQYTRYLLTNNKKFNVAFNFDLTEFQMKLIEKYAKSRKE